MRVATAARTLAKTTRLELQKGFTLIELMIVVAVLGIVAAIAIPNFLRYQMTSRQAEARTNLGGIFVAQTGYFGERSTYSSFDLIGFQIAGAGTNRYTYYTGAANGNGGNAGINCPAANCDIIRTSAPALLVIPYQNAAVTVANSLGATAGFTAAASANLDGDATNDGWYVNDLKQGVTAAVPNDVMG